MNTLRVCFRSLTCLRSVNYESRRYYKRSFAPIKKELTARKRKEGAQSEPKRSNFIEWNRESEIYAFNKRLSEEFDTQKLEQAFTHKSYIIEEEKKQRDMGVEDPHIDLPHNEELLNKGGDLTSKVITKYLTTMLPNSPGSVLIALHDYLLSRETLAKAASHIGTKDIILTAEHPVTEETLANTFLAIVAALEESVDANHAALFVRDFLIVALAEKDLSELWSPSNPYETLNKVLLKNKRTPVEPRMISRAGTNTLLAVYQIAMYSDKEFLGSGYGQTIEEAKDVAATNVLCRMYGLLDSSRPIKFNLKIDVN